MKKFIKTVLLKDILESISLPEDFVEEGYSFTVVGDELHVLMYEEVVVKAPLQLNYNLWEDNNQKFIIIDCMCLKMFVN